MRQLWTIRDVSVHEHGSAAGRRAVNCVVVTVSDTRTAENDSSGDELQAQLEQAGHLVASRELVPDDPDQVRGLIAAIVSGGSTEAVVLTGGTGLAPRDGTCEGVDSLLDKRLDGFGELFRFLSYQEIGAAAMLSRAVAGVVGAVLVLSLPGSTAACRLAAQRLLVPELGHMVALVRPKGQ